MKPARGSGRKSTQGPTGKGRRAKKNVPTSGESDHSGEGEKQQPGKKRKRLVLSTKANIRGREKWKPLAQPIISALDRMLGLSVLTVLSINLKKKDADTQTHLNNLKERFLASCAQLAVPPRKQVDLSNDSRQYQAERLKTAEGKKRLESLEENLRSVVSTLEEIEVTKDRLEEECRILRSRIEDQEDNSREILQRREQAVLHLPPLPPRSETEQPLQERLMKSVPNGIAVVKQLQNMPEIQQLSTFMGLAHKHADQWLTTLNSDTQN